MFGNSKNMPPLPPIPPNRSELKTVGETRGGRDDVPGITPPARILTTHPGKPGLKDSAGPELPESDYDDDGEEEDLYEPPPCEAKSRAPPIVWTKQSPDCLYSDRLEERPALSKIITPEKSQQNWPQVHRPQTPGGATFSFPRPQPISIQPPPVPSADRRMSLPFTALRSHPPSVVKPFQEEDDVYLNVLETKITQNYDGNAGCAENVNEKTEDPGVLGKPWYVGDMDRNEAVRRLRKINKDGCFLVRISSAHSQMQPYTLALMFKDLIYNIPIRAIVGKGYVLGKGGKQNEKIFPSVVHLIEYYKQEQINLVNRQTNIRQSTLLQFSGHT